jgi:UDP-N-acetylmuramate-alanine ligase
MVIDDYAASPAEIEAVIRGAGGLQAAHRRGVQPRAPAVGP